MQNKRVCIDVGGTLTDCLVMDESGLLQKFKASTTPRDPSIGLMDAMKKAARFYKLDAPPTLAEFTELAKAWQPFRTWATVLLRLAGDRRFGR